MKLSTHTRYAIRILFELHLARGPISIAALSELTNIGLKTVENIHAVLRQNDITASIIGAHGGIRLNKPLSAISLGKMIELFDEGVRFVVCFGEKPASDVTNFGQTFSISPRVNSIRTPNACKTDTSRSAME